ncbi:hypothetical protein L1987_00029 [Smallanthus sonchifolius]|uniref:Uncharacterized protein n=1 Tax=Smallanthus sonchifolius TaxID=185202 RepID=A0ACB9K103_9ASTR|nr:hypothetical protein L1987_00029 [Smallanthus sonchifolius]
MNLYVCIPLLGTDSVNIMFRTWSVDNALDPIVAGSMLKNRSSPPLHLLHTAMSLRPSPAYRGGRNQWRSRGFSNLPYSPVTDNVINDNNDANHEFRPDYNSHPPPRFNFRPNSNPHFNHYPNPPPAYSNPYQKFAPPPLYNQNQQFRRQGPPYPHFNPNQQFRPPPLYNQGQQPPNIDQNQQFRPPPYQQFAPLQGQFRPQQRFRPSKAVSDYRNWEQAKPGPPPTCERFTVLSYNILADYLAINHRSKLYFHIPRHILDWESRKRNIMFELGLWSDILCFQEVDRFQDFEEGLKIRGYNGIWKMRTGEPVDGCAIFWRSSRFKLLHEEAIEFNKFGLRDNVAQICVLESLSEKSSAGSPSPAACSEGRNKVVICNIHVLYNPKRGEIKLGQVRILLEKSFATSKLWDDAPVVLCGDFNSTPKSSLYNFVSEQKLNVSELPRDKISGQYSAEIRPKRPFTLNFRTQSIDNATQSTTRVDNKGELSSSLLSDNTHKDEKTAPQLEAKEESEGNSVNCTSEVLENISPDVITGGNNSVELLEAIEDASVGEDSTLFLSELHGPDATDVADGADLVDGEPFVENQNPFYDPSGWTPMEIEAATGSSECMTMEHHLKLRSTYTEVEDYSGTRDSYGEPQVTSYHRGFQGTVDYIWRSEGLQTVRVLAPIPKHAMEWTPGFPTKKWGSDHVALVAELAFNKLIDDEKSQAQ